MNNFTLEDFENEANEKLRQLMATNSNLIHSEILNKLLGQIKPFDIRSYLGIPEDEDLKQRHFVVGYIKNLLETAKKYKWALCKTFESVYVYNGAYWQQMDKEDLKMFLGKCVINMGCPEYDALHCEFKDKLVKQFFSDAHLPQPQPNPDKILINLKNGTFEFINGEWKLKVFNHEDFLTYQLSFEYNKNAKCELFEKYLLKVLPHESSRMLLQEFAGYIFTKFNLEKMLMLTGGGANGKSVFFNIVTSLLGKDNVLNYSMGSFEKETNRAKLVNILLNYSSEKGTDLDPEIFKALISAEPLQARLLYQNPFTLYNTAKFIINANRLPQETEQTQAYFRRWIIIPFDVTIPEAERDTELANKIIKTELAGVFNWLLIGLERLAKNKSFTVCEQSNKALAEFKRQSDNVALFIDDQGHQKHESLKIGLKELYQSYKIFCLDDGYRPLGKNNFAKRFEDKGFEACRLNNGDKGFFVFVKKDSPF